MVLKKFLLNCFVIFALSLVGLATGIVVLTQSIAVAWLDFCFVVFIAISAMLSWVMVLNTNHHNLIRSTRTKQASQYSTIYHTPTFENYQHLKHLMKNHQGQYQNAKFCERSSKPSTNRAKQLITNEG